MTTYVPQSWVNGSALTPLSAARLAHIEAGLFTARTMPNRSTGVLIPMYIYPSSAYSNADYNGLIALARKYRNVPLIAVINNSNGPGASQDGNFTVVITRMRAAGIIVCGYIDTNYRAVTAASVESQIDTWLSFYPAIDGLFFDQQDNDASSASLTYYSAVTTYAHNKGLYPIISNPGTPLLGDYYAAGLPDIYCIHENSSYPSEATLEGDYAGGNADYPWDRRAVLVYNQTALSPAQLAIIRKYAGWVYVTTDNLPNPWDSLPSYLESLISNLDRPVGTAAIDDTGSGLILRDNAGTPHYWRVSVSSGGVLSTTDLGTARPAS